MFELSLVKALQAIGNPFLDYLMFGLTYLGDELFFMAVALILYWCVDKRFGFKVMNVFIVSAAVVEGFKNIFDRPRPYEEGAKSIFEPTDGGSMPSGHTHTIANLSTQTALRWRKRPLIILGAVLTAVVALTRLYLGQHYLTDVLVGAALGLGLAWGVSLLFELLKDREDKIVFVVLPLCFLLAVVLRALGFDNEKLFTVLGVYPALCIGYYAEKRYIRLNVRTVWYKNLCKIFIGGIAVGVFYFLPDLLPLPQEVMLTEFLKYFVVGIMATVGAMELFNLLKLYDKEPAEIFNIPAAYIELTETPDADVKSAQKAEKPKKERKKKPVSKKSETPETEADAAPPDTDEADGAEAAAGQPRRVEKPAAEAPTEEPRTDGEPEPAEPVEPEPAAEPTGAESAEAKAAEPAGTEKPSEEGSKNG
ncbi:MAG: phosphatase PAP2 family protein [Clostridiales bacterium]|jgi:undecaprenyl-diphosphatase|nr:phosphatase PAP2 family protein [Clostridiales bacterium]